jgi:hypothetical protein
MLHLISREEAMEYTKATPTDADLVMRLYEMRREPVMRQARNWFMQFNPKNAGDVLAVASAFGNQENAYFRQVVSYWEMAVTLALRGAISQDIFVDWNGEFIFMYSKFHPFLAEVREKLGNPGFLQHCEHLIERIPGGKDRVEATIARIAKMSAAKK